MCKSSFRSRWTRRSALQAGVGLTVAAVTRESWGAQVTAQGFCTDRPILTGRESEREAARRSPVAFAQAFTNGRNDILRAAIPARETANLNRAFAPRIPRANAPIRDTDGGPLNLPSTGPMQAAYLRRWSQDRIRVHFMNFANSLGPIVLRTVEEWSSWAKLDFVPETNPRNADIRVNFVRRAGHWSYVATDARSIPLNEATMNLDMSSLDINNEANQGVILHEFGHVLGQVHEHSSAASTINFLPAEQLVEFFRGSGVEGLEAVRLNVTRRYTSAELIRFSDFDPRSVMTYFIPPHLTRDGRGLNVNTILSSKDKEYAVRMYPGRRPLTDVPGGDLDPGSTETTQPTEITLGADPVEGKLSAGKTVELKLTVPSGQAGSIVIKTSGTTAVMLKITNSFGTDVTPADKPSHGSPDLMNEVISMTLATGEYKVAVSHPSPRGGGYFKIQAKTGTYDSFLISPNKRQ